MKYIFFLCLICLAGNVLAQNFSEALVALGNTQQVMLFMGFVAIGLGMLSSGWALSISLGAYAACDKEHRASAFLPALLPGSQGLYSFAISFMMIQNMAFMPQQAAIAGVICGLPCLFCAIGQAKTAAACIKAINNGQMDRGQALLATGVPGLYALTGLAGAFWVMV